MSAERSAVFAAAEVGDGRPGDGTDAGCASDLMLLAGSRPEAAVARQVRARALVAGEQPAEIAAAIASQCGSSRIRAYRLALGIALADVVAQVRARYEADGRRVPRFSETLLSAYESGQKRPGPEYLHYLCATYQADPADLGFDGRCLCGQSHGPAPAAAPAPGAPVPGAPAPVSPDALAATAYLPAAAASAPPPAPPGAAVAGLAAAPAVGQSALSPGLPGSVPVLPPQRSPRAHPLAQAHPAASGPVLPSGSGLQAAAGTERLAAGLAQSDRATATRPDSDDDDNELRTMLLRQMAEPGNQVDSRFLGAVDRIRRRMDEALLGGTVSATMIDRWEQGTAGYGTQYMTVPPLRLLCDVLLDFADVRRMCEERQPLEFSERMCRVASQLAGLAGIAMLDLGDHRLARSFFRTARTAADETGDRQLRAWVTAREALVPLYYGDPREAASLAGAASDLAGRHLCAAAVMAPVVEARAQARLVSVGTSGRREALDRARAVLDRAEDALADLRPDQCSDTALGYTERQLYFYTGDILVSLGDWQAAHRAYSQAGQLYAGTEVLDGALVAFGQARCLLEAEEPDQALEFGRDILARLPAEHRTDVILQVARTLGQEAASRYPRLTALPGYREALQTA